MTSMSNTNLKKGDALKYQEKPIKPVAEQANEIGLVKFRYKEPESDSSTVIRKPLPGKMTKEPSSNYYWSSAVAMFGMELRGSFYKGQKNYKLIRQMASKGKGADEKGFRSGFIR